MKVRITLTLQVLSGQGRINATSSLEIPLPCCTLSAWPHVIAVPAAGFTGSATSCLMCVGQNNTEVVEGFLFRGYQLANAIMQAAPLHNKCSWAQAELLKAGSIKAKCAIATNELLFNITNSKQAVIKSVQVQIRCGNPTVLTSPTCAKSQDKWQYMKLGWNGLNVTYQGASATRYYHLNISSGSLTLPGCSCKNVYWAVRQKGIFVINCNL
jgi:hypothetical protein